MEHFFCYEHNKMAFRAGDDHYHQPVFYCEKGGHYLTRAGESKRHVDVQPRKDLELLVKSK